MTTDDIIKMAKEYADEVTNSYGVAYYEFDLYGLEKFALLIRAAEREWQGLTDEEVRDLWSWSMTAEAERTANTQQHAFARTIEAKLKERNT